MLRQIRQKAKKEKKSRDGSTSDDTDANKNKVGMIPTGMGWEGFFSVRDPCVKLALAVFV